MEYTPYDYQRKAINFIKNHPSAALLLDMGLGKTVISLTSFFELRNEGKANKLLVIAPKRVAEISWPAELETWDHLSSFSFSIIRGDEKKRIQACQTEADIYLIGRDSVDWLVKSKNCPKCDMLIVDEMQSFKSPSSARTKALIKLRSSFSRCVGLSGTPAPNGWLDLWSQYRIIDEGIALGPSFWNFRTAHFDPGKLIKRAGKLYPINYVPKKGHESLFEERIAPITLSMKAIDNLKLPPIRYTHLYSEMTEDEKSVYDGFTESLEGYLGGEHLKVPSDEALVMKLVQLASGTAYNGDKIVPFHNHKIEALLEMVQEAEEKPFLVAYWFKGDYERIVSALDAQHISNADISSQKAVEDWNAGRLQVGLIHPAKAGHGLNLQKGGCTLVWYTMPWNYELYAQTNARLYRNGQKNAVTVVHLMTRYTIDDAIYSVLLKKQTLQMKLIEDMKNKNESEQELDLFYDKIETVQEQTQKFVEAQKQNNNNKSSFIYIPYKKGDVLPKPIIWVPVLTSYSGIATERYVFEN